MTASLGPSQSPPGGNDLVRHHSSQAQGDIQNLMLWGLNITATLGALDPNQKSGTQLSDNACVWLGGQLPDRSLPTWKGARLGEHWLLCDTESPWRGRCIGSSPGLSLHCLHGKHANSVLSYSWSVQPRDRSDLSILVASVGSIT